MNPLYLIPVFFFTLVLFAWWILIVRPAISLRTFARENGLSFHFWWLAGSPRVSGEFNGYPISQYSLTYWDIWELDPHILFEDISWAREVELKSRIPAGFSLVSAQWSGSLDSFLSVDCNFLKKHLKSTNSY